MADKAISDQPTMRTVSQLRELPWDSKEAMDAMLDAVEGSMKGSEVMLPVEDDEGTVDYIPYVHDGEGLLHRGDLKPAKVLRAEGERLAAAAQKRAERHG